jgi:ribosomal protein S18 acetylase RimI-like enzyme
MEQFMGRIRDRKRNMKENISISFRETLIENDIPGIKEIVEETGVFTVGDVGIAEELLLDGYRNGPSSYYWFIIGERNGIIEGYICYSQIGGTIGSYEAYWVVVRKSSHKTGIGTKLMMEMEKIIREKGGKRIFLGTSSRIDYIPAHRFYESMGYRKVAVLEDFFDAGDDQIMYRKVL